MPSKKKRFNARFPPARIKKIMQKDEEVGKVAQAVPVIIAKALESFAEQLLTISSDVTRSRNARTLTPNHIKTAIHNKTEFHFLRELTQSIPDVNNMADEEPSLSSSTSSSVTSATTLTTMTTKTAPANTNVTTIINPVITQPNQSLPTVAPIPISTSSPTVITISSSSSSPEPSTTPTTTSSSLTSKSPPSSTTSSSFIPKSSSSFASASKIVSKISASSFTSEIPQIVNNNNGCKVYQATPIPATTTLPMVLPAPPIIIKKPPIHSSRGRGRPRKCNLTDQAQPASSDQEGNSQTQVTINKPIRSATTCGRRGRPPSTNNNNSNNSRKRQKPAKSDEEDADSDDLVDDEDDDDVVYDDNDDNNDDEETEDELDIIENGDIEMNNNDKNETNENETASSLLSTMKSSTNFGTLATIAAATVPMTSNNDNEDDYDNC